MKKSGFSDDRMVGAGHTLRVSATDPFVANRSIFSSRRPRRFSKRGQQAAEYMVMFAAVTTAFILINIYARRGLQSRIKELVDVEIGPQADGSPLTIPIANEWSSSSVVASSRSNTRERQDGAQATSWFDSRSTSSGVAVSVVNQDISSEG